MSFYTRYRPDPSSYRPFTGTSFSSRPPPTTYQPTFPRSALFDKPFHTSRTRYRSPSLHLPCPRRRSLSLVHTDYVYSPTSGFTRDGWFFYSDMSRMVEGPSKVAHRERKMFRTDREFLAWIKAGRPLCSEPTYSKEDMYFDKGTGRWREDPSTVANRERRMFDTEEEWTEWIYANPKAANLRPLSELRGDTTTRAAPTLFSRNRSNGRDSITAQISKKRREASDAEFVHQYDGKRVSSARSSRQMQEEPYPGMMSAAALFEYAPNWGARHGYKHLVVEINPSKSDATLSTKPTQVEREASSANESIRRYGSRQNSGIAGSPVPRSSSIPYHCTDQTFRGRTRARGSNPIVRASSVQTFIEPFSRSSSALSDVLGSTAKPCFSYVDSFINRTLETACAAIRVEMDRRDRRSPSLAPGPPTPSNYAYLYGTPVGTDAGAGIAYTPPVALSDIEGVSSEASWVKAFKKQYGASVNVNSPAVSETGRTLFGWSVAASAISGVGSAGHSETRSEIYRRWGLTPPISLPGSSALSGSFKLPTTPTLPASVNNDDPIVTASSTPSASSPEMFSRLHPWSTMSPSTTPLVRELPFDRTNLDEDDLLYTNAFRRDRFDADHGAPAGYMVRVAPSYSRHGEGSMQLRHRRNLERTSDWIAREVELRDELLPAGYGQDGPMLNPGSAAAFPFPSDEALMGPRPSLHPRHALAGPRFFDYTAPVVNERCYNLGFGWQSYDQAVAAAEQGNEFGW